MATRSPNACRNDERDRRRQRNLGHEQQNATSAAAHFGREPQVELGLAAAGDAVQERRLEIAALDEPPQTGQRGLLFRRSGRAPGVSDVADGTSAWNGSRSICRRVNVTRPSAARRESAGEPMPRAVKSDVSRPSGAPARRASASRCRGPSRIDAPAPRLPRSSPCAVSAATRTVRNPRAGPPGSAAAAIGGIAVASAEPMPQA